MRYTAAMETAQVQLSSEARAALTAHLVAAYPHEGCGALIGTLGDRARIERAVGLPNRQAPSTDDRFEIDPLSYGALEAQLRGTPQRIIGFFHSHPDGVALPSSIDLEMAQGLFDVAREYFVYAIQVIGADGPGELTFWRLREDRGAFEKWVLLAD